MMHAANPQKSERMKRILDFLSDGQPHSTLEIANGALVCAVSTAISELRSRGYDISPAWREGGIYYYRMNSRSV